MEKVHHSSISFTYFVHSKWNFCVPNEFFREDFVMQRCSEASLKTIFFPQTIDFCSQKLKNKGNSLNSMGDALPPGLKRERSFFSFFFLSERGTLFL